MNIGVLGGTFDPIHNGHLLVAAEVRKRLNLAKVIFVPAGQPYFKQASPVSLAKHRLEMVKLAISDKPCFALSTLEIERPGPSYAVETLAGLKDLLQADELFFILGWGSLTELPQWKEPSRIIKLCQLVVVPRPGYKLPDLKALESKIPGLSGRLILMDKPRIDVSASDIRGRVSQGLSISQLVPQAVERYIKQHELYTVKKP